MGGGLFSKIQNIEFYNNLTTFLSNHNTNNIARQSINILHRIRDLGNRGAHSKKANKKCVTSDDSKFVIHQLRRLANLVVLGTDYNGDDAESSLLKYKNPTLIEFVNGYGDKNINLGSFTQEQLAFLGEFSDFLNDTSRNIFVLRGYAGSGKTYIISVIWQYPY